MKKSLCLLLSAMLVFGMLCFGASAAAEADVEILRTEADTRFIDGEEKTIYLTTSMSPPSYVNASVSGTTVRLNWAYVSNATLYSVYEKINGSWSFLKSCSTTSYSLTASYGTHTYGISSVKYYSSSGNFYESKYVRSVTVTVNKPADPETSTETPGASDPVTPATLSGTTDQTINLDVEKNAYLHIVTDSLTWYSTSDGNIAEPHKVGGYYYTSLGNDFYLNLNKYYTAGKKTILVTTLDYSTTTYSGQQVYTLGDRRAYFYINLNFLPYKYTVSFDANGGTGEMAAVTVTEGENYTLPECGFTPPAGYMFDTWSQGAPGTEISVTSDMTITAYWKAITYTVTFDPNGGTGEMSSYTVSPGEQFALPECGFTAPYGKEFAAWDMGAPETMISVSADTVIKALWKDIQCVISFVPNGGTGVMDPVNVLYGSVYTLPACGFTAAEGWEFVSWDLGAPGTQITVTANIELTANWREKPVEGAHVMPDGSEYTVNSDMTAEFKKPNPNTSSVTVPDTIMVYGHKVKVTSIANKAFYKNKKLKSVKIGKNIKTIGKSAFEGCVKLTKVSGGTGIETIRDNAFKGCKALPAFTFNKKVTKIGKSAFEGCAKLKKIVFKTTKLTKAGIGKNSFKKIGKKATVKCPKKLLENYKEWLLKNGKMPEDATFTK